MVLGDQRAIHRLHDMCKAMPGNVRKLLVGLVMGLMRRLDKAVSITESFLYESESRYLWKSEGDRVVSSFGIHATNPVQKLWMYYNRIEDDREKYMQEWTMAKFVIGPHAPKSVQKLNQRDQQSEESTKERREQLQHRMYYEAMGVVTPEQRKTTRVENKEGVTMAVTTEELQEQMRAWVAGEKDRHDQVVDYIKAKIRHERESEQQRLEQQRQELADLMDQEGITLGGTLRPMAGDAAEELLSRLRLRNLNPGAKRVFSTDSHNSAYDKYIKNNPDVGTLRVNEDGEIVVSTKLDEKDRDELLGMLAGKPEKRDLTADIDALRPTIKYER